MAITVQSPADRASIWDHFLMKDTTISVAFGTGGGGLRQVPLQRVRRRFRSRVASGPPESAYELGTVILERPSRWTEVRSASHLMATKDDRTAGRPSA